MAQKPVLDRYSHGYGIAEVIRPVCPTCGSNRKRCMRGSEHEAWEWHVAREYALAEALGWTGWSMKPGYVVATSCVCGCGGGMLLNPEPRQPS